MKLEIELVPETAWKINFRTRISREGWDKIRKQAYSEADNKCGICRKEGKLNCHEIWEYDDKKHIQRLKGFIALCDDCHMIKHIGFASIQASEGKLDMKKLIEHFLKVNGENKDVFEEHKSNAFSIWEERSKHKWRVDFGKWAELIK
jgi:hypothetical protein